MAGLDQSRRWCGGGICGGWIAGGMEKENALEDGEQESVLHAGERVSSWGRQSPAYERDLQVVHVFSFKLDHVARVSGLGSDDVEAD